MYFRGLLEVYSGGQVSTDLRSIPQFFCRVSPGNGFDFLLTLHILTVVLPREEGEGAAARVAVGENVYFFARHGTLFWHAALS